jgi:hypothetical protein
MRLELTGDGPGGYRLLLNGEDFSEATSLTLRADGVTAQVVIELELYDQPLTVDAEVPTVVVPEHTARALKTLGWTPPAEKIGE